MSYKRKDGFYTRAKEAGYRSRAAYKLLELHRRYRLIRAGNRVVDLGAWPGGWLQVAAELAGPRGRVIGVDVVRIDPVSLPGVVCLEGNVMDSAVQEEIARLADGPVDVLLSDMAPKLTGVRATDMARAAELSETCVALATRLLRANGRMLMKVFNSDETDRLFSSLRGSFNELRRTRPQASRAGSTELYFIGLGFRRSRR